MSLAGRSLTRRGVVHLVDFCEREGPAMEQLDALLTDEDNQGRLRLRVPGADIQANVSSSNPLLIDSLVLYHVSY